MAKRLYRDGQYLGGSRPAKRCAKGHKLVASNVVFVGKGNGTRCKICRKAINDNYRLRKALKETKAEI